MGVAKHLDALHKRIMTRLISLEIVAIVRSNKYTIRDNPESTLDRIKSPYKDL